MSYNALITPEFRWNSSHAVDDEKGNDHAWIEKFLENDTLQIHTVDSKFIGGDHGSGQKRMIKTIIS